MVGDPELRAGKMIQLDGLGPDFSGNYRLRSTVHTISTGGYTTQLQAAREILP